MLHCLLECYSSNRRSRIQSLISVHSLAMSDLESLLAAQETGRVTQKKWLADVAANHLSGQPALSAKNGAAECS
jgi:hypothetical protein